MKQISQENLQFLVNQITAATNGFTAQAQNAVSALSQAHQAGGAVDERILGDLAAAARALSAQIHDAKKTYDWRINPTPEWFDHFLDQHLQFRVDQSSFWAERGTFGSLALAPAAELLELCCGDGFNAYHFYAPRCHKVVSVDFDPTALAHARTYNAAPNIDYRQCDIRTDMPKGVFTNIVWDAAIEHFTEAEIAIIMAEIRSRLTPNGLLSGYTLVERDDGAKHLHEHEREFTSMDDLMAFLTPHFANVRVFETIHPERHNLYFFASDGDIPFDADWPRGISHRR